MESTQPNGQLSIAWRNLHYEPSTDYFDLPSKILRNRQSAKKRPILCHLSGHFESGTLNALLGPSGAGKTTLLRCLSGGNVRLSPESEIYINSSASSSFFIEQQVHENIVARMRIGEILSYAFRLKNHHAGHETMKSHIQLILQKLMLDEHILARRFCDCSGGEQKRVAIGQELCCLQPPRFLFIDEPTTGLDSAAAIEMAHTLVQLVQGSNKELTLVASIHVPSSEVIALFHRLYVLSKDGVCIYADAPAELEDFLLKHSLVVENATKQTPIEALIKVASTQSESSLKLANQIHSTEYELIEKHLPLLISAPNGVPLVPKPFSLTDLCILLNRQTRIEFISNSQVFLFQLFILNSVVLLLSTIFNHKMVLPDGCYRRNESISEAYCTSDLEQHFTSLLLQENINFLVMGRMIGSYMVLYLGALLYSSMVKVVRSEYRNGE